MITAVGVRRRGGKIALRRQPGPGQHRTVLTVLRTDRVTLRAFTPGDVDLLVELDSDPEVMRYLTGGRPTPRDVVRERVLPRIRAGYRRDPGYGTWAAVVRDTGAFIGWFALTRQAGSDPAEAELGYRLRRAAWGFGYATEVSLALVDAGFTGDPALQRVYAQTMAVNTASRRVMERCGMRFVRTFHLHFDDPIPGTEHGEVEYEVTRSEWAARRRPGASIAAR